MDRFSRLQALTGDKKVYDGVYEEEEEEVGEEEEESKFQPFMFPTPQPRHLYEGTDSEDDEIIISRRSENNAAYANQNFHQAEADGTPNDFKEYLLQQGEKAREGETFVNFQVIRKYPFAYIGNANRQKVAEAFFDQGKVYNQIWDFFYLYRLPSDPTKQPIILVPTKQFEFFLWNINRKLGTSLRIPTGGKVAFHVTFDNDGTPQPRYLGRATSREMADDLKNNIPPAYYLVLGDKTFNGKPSDRSLTAFQAKVALMVQATKANKQASKAKNHKVRLEKQRSWNSVTKRVQRYLGLREVRRGHHAAMRASQEGINLQWADYDNAVKTAAAGLDPGYYNFDPAKPTPFEPEGEVVFVCIDVEAVERNQNLITEIGVATLDTKDLAHLAPGEKGENWMKMIRPRHFRINEQKHHVNHEFVVGCPDKFEFGTSEFINQADIPEIVASCFKHPFSKPGAAPLDNVNSPKRSIIFVGHGIASDIAFLQKVGYNIYNLSNLQEFADTADMHRYLRRLESPRNLACVLSELGLIGWNLHNAGNDAVYTLQAMIGIAIEHLKAKRKDKETLVQEKQARLQEAYKEQMETAKQKIREREESWSSGDDGDGGPPNPPEDASQERGKKSSSTISVMPNQATRAWKRTPTKPGPMRLALHDEWRGGQTIDEASNLGVENPPSSQATVGTTPTNPSSRATALNTQGAIPSQTIGLERPFQSLGVSSNGSARAAGRAKPPYTESWWTVEDK